MTTIPELDAIVDELLEVKDTLSPRELYDLLVDLSFSYDFKIRDIIVTLDDNGFTVDVSANTVKIKEKDAETK